MIRLTEPGQVGAQIKVLRKQQGLLQRDLEARCGMAQCRVSEIERGRVEPTLATAGRMLAALGWQLAIVEREGA